MLTLRSTKGSPLTYAEADANFSGLADGSLSSFSAGTGALTKTVQSKLRNTIDLNDYAACDGTTDDTAQIALILASLPSAGGTIRINGTPLVSATTVLTKPIKFLFEGALGDPSQNPTSYFIKKSTMTTAAFQLSSVGIVWSGGGVKAQVGNTGNNIEVLANGIVLEYVTSYLAGQDGFRLGADGVGISADYCELRSCRSLSNVRYGFYNHSGDTNANVNLFENCFGASNGSDGMYVNKSLFNSIINYLGESNTGAGLRIGALSNYSKIVGGDREGNVGGQIVLDDGHQNTAIDIGNISEVTDNSTATTSTTTRRLDRLIQKMGPVTLILRGSTTAGAQTYATQIGFYERCGDFCDVQFGLTLTALDAATAGNMQISGLPFAMDAGFTGAVCGASISQWGNFTLTGGYTQLCGRIAAGGQVIDLLQSGSGVTAGFVTKAMASNTSQVVGSIRYPIAKF